MPEPLACMTEMVYPSITAVRTLWKLTEDHLWKRHGGVYGGHARVDARMGHDHRWYSLRCSTWCPLHIVSLHASKHKEALESGLECNVDGGT